MRILYFDNLDYNSDYADLVTCHHCDNGNTSDKYDAMLVPCGMERCPICGDPTEWKDDDNDRYEVSIDEILKTDEVIHRNANYDESYDDMADEITLIPLNNN